MLPQIRTAPSGIGFRWARPDGTPATLTELLDLPNAEADRWLPTHLQALDEVLIEVAGRFGEVLGGGRRPRDDEIAALAAAYVDIDRACVEYADAFAAAKLPRRDLRDGQIIGTATLLSIRCREVLGLIGGAPFEGELDRPTPGMVGGRAGLHWVNEAEAWRGARWLVVTDDGLRLPATLSMLLFDSSGVDKDATLREHHEALSTVRKAAAQSPEPLVTAGALDWLLFDFLMAHRESEDSAAVELKPGRVNDAALIVTSAAESVRARRRFDPALG